MLAVIGALVVAGLSQWNAKPTRAGMVRGVPQVAVAANPGDFETNRNSAVDYQVADPSTPMPTAMPTVAPSTPQRPVATQREPASSSSGAASQGGGGNVQARETQNREADAMRDELREREQRADDAMHSLGSATVASQASDSTGYAVADNGTVGTAGNAVAQTGATVAGVGYAGDGTEYAPPSGTILALDTRVPVRLTQRIDSTFGGEVPLRVTADVPDETGQRVLIPSGTTCYAKASQGGVDGQQRMYVAANLCKLPNRSRLVLDDFPAVDADGATGLKARVDDHGAHRRGGMGVLPLLGSGLLPGGAAVSAVSEGAAYASASRSVQAVPGPTLYVDADPQHPRDFSLLVSKDVGINPYGG